MISLELETAEDLAPVDGDAGQIQQIILNSALNGVESMPNGGKVRIQTRNLTLGKQSGDSHSGSSLKLRASLGFGYRTWNGYGNNATYVQSILHHKKSRFRQRYWPRAPHGPRKLSWRTAEI